VENTKQFHITTRLPPRKAGYFCAVHNSTRLDEIEGRALFVTVGWRIVYVPRR
jgi:hypothetical protein